MTSTALASGTIDLYWIPLGAGGSGFVRLNGRIYEGVVARLEGRAPLALFHTALQVQLPEGHFVVETMWPSPDTETLSRGVVGGGPVWSPLLARWRTFHYEVRCWRDGLLPDAEAAVGGPQRVSNHADHARHLLQLAAAVPSLTWGRTPPGTGEMWNSNSVISWLLAQSGVSMETVRPPTGGRAPGWETGVRIATSTRFPRPSGLRQNGHGPLGTL